MEVVTGEDFVVPAAWLAALTWVRRTWAMVPQMDEGDFAVPGGRLRLVDLECEKVGIPKDVRKKILVAIKDHLFGNLKRSQIESHYYDALVELSMYMDDRG